MATATRTNRRNAPPLRPAAPNRTIVIETGDRPIAGVDEVRERAFAIYQRRLADGLPGNALSDWVQAERELKNSRARENARRGDALMRGDGE